MHWSTDSRRVQAKTAIHPPHSEQPVKAVVPKQLANKPALVNCLGHDGEQAANTADSRIVIKNISYVETGTRGAKVSDPVDRAARLIRSTGVTFSSSGRGTDPDTLRGNPFRSHRDVTRSAMARSDRSGTARIVHRAWTAMRLPAGVRCRWRLRIHAPTWPAWRPTATPARGSRTSRPRPEGVGPDRPENAIRC